MSSLQALHYQPHSLTLDAEIITFSFCFNCNYNNMHFIINKIQYVYNLVLENSKQNNKLLYFTAIYKIKITFSINTPYTVLHTHQNTHTHTHTHTHTYSLQK